MPLTLLLDLDDTLLRNVVNAFIPAYLKALGEHLNQYQADRVVHKVMGATQQMMIKRTPALTMEQVFDQYFYPGIGAEKRELLKTIQTFYKETFPTLRSITSPSPEAKPIINFAFEHGWKVVIATNPLFPKTATMQRLDWAGIPMDQYPYELVTTYEGLHFCKPSPEYYAETLAQIGWPEQPAVMIGNSLSDDILPVSFFGMPAFWLDGDASQLQAGFHLRSRIGPAKDILSWLEDLDSSPEGLESRFESPRAILAVLKSTPAALETIVSKLNVDQMLAKPASGEWSINEILCHLQDVDQEVNLPRMDKLCSEENPFLPGIVTDPWAQERQYQLQDGRFALRNFMKARTQLANILESIPFDQWNRIARHAIFGPTTIRELAGFIVTHDQVHIRQVFAGLKTQGL